MERLAKLATYYDQAKNHPFRLQRIGSPKLFADALSLMVEEYTRLVLEQEKAKQVDYRRGVIGTGWLHQARTLVANLRYKKSPVTPTEMTFAEAYIGTIHNYLRNDGEVLEYSYHIGNERTGQRTITLCFYPCLNDYEYNRTTAIMELEHYNFEQETEDWLKTYMGEGVRKEHREKCIKQMRDRVATVKKIAQGLITTDMKELPKEETNQ